MGAAGQKAGNGWERLHFIYPHHVLNLQHTTTLTLTNGARGPLFGPCRSLRTTRARACVKGPGGRWDPFVRSCRTCIVHLHVRHTLAASMNMDMLHPGHDRGSECGCSASWAANMQSRAVLSSSPPLRLPPSASLRGAVGRSTARDCICLICASPPTSASCHSAWLCSRL